MSDGLDRIVPLKKQCTFSNSIKFTQNNVVFSYFIKIYEHWDKKNPKKKSSMEKIMRLILEEVIMSDRHMSDGQFFVNLITLFNVGIV